MKQLFFFSVSALLFLAGCGGEPTPEEKSRAAMLAKLEAGHKQRFLQDGSSLKKQEKGPAHKSADDPSAYVYKGKILNNAEEKAWKEEGIENREYPKWARLGVNAKEATQWKALGISYEAISVFHMQKYTPHSAGEFMKREFFTRPSFYAQFGTPVYDFDSICLSVIKRQQPPFAFLEERCIPYMNEAHRNEAIGHLLDESEITKGPLALEYLAELRRLALDNAQIQSGMEVTIEEFIEDEDTENFVFLFPLLQNEPTREEMAFIDEHKLPLQEEERFFSFQNPEYWIHRAEAQAAAEEAAARQEALLRAKKEKERKTAALNLAKAEALAREKARRQEEYRKQKIAQKAEAIRRTKAKKVCGAYINPDQLSGQQVLLEGEVIFTVEEAGERMFGYGVKARNDDRIYFVRDPKNMAKAEISDTISWRLKTMGRTEALSQQSEDTFSYDKKSKTKFTMALFLQKCEL